MTTRPTSTAKRQSSTNPAATTSTAGAPVVKPRCNIHPSATVADRAQLTGSHNVAVGENSVVHPHARLRADAGDVVIGRNCIVAERAVVGPPVDEAGLEGPAIGGGGGGGEVGECVICNGVAIETGAVVEARKVGENSTIGANARISPGAVVGAWCQVGPLCKVGAGEVLEDYTIVFGDGMRRTDRTAKERMEVREAKTKGREREVELLKTLIADSSAKWMG